MKSFIINPKDDPAKFAPCDGALVSFDKSIKDHPAIFKIRNKRKRLREIKRLHRAGVRFYLAQGWEITPH